MEADFILAIKSAIFLIGATRLDHPGILLGVSSISLLSFVVSVLVRWEELAARSSKLVVIASLLEHLVITSERSIKLCSFQLSVGNVRVTLR